MKQSRLFNYREDDDSVPPEMVRPRDDCKLCGLCAGRTNLVLPSGDLRSRVAFVGEAPGETEDNLGRPFVGKSGKLLDRLMKDEGLDRSKVMITNTVKCRPPNNRAPTEEEMAACRQFLESELYGKDVIVGLGKSSCRDLLGYEGKMGDIVNKDRSIVVRDREILFIPTYHPAACIYNRGSTDALRATIRRIRDEFV
ncbi:MAG: uracil-DNA glycosylase [Candidatus Methanoplasma sp.]|jgi:DNA polymerase|nr:uracil-DNA glycosylase [Candidatus Methanoplasma sp.]